MDFAQPPPPPLPPPPGAAPNVPPPPVGLASGPPTGSPIAQDNRTRNLWLSVVGIAAGLIGLGIVSAVVNSATAPSSASSNNAASNAPETWPEELAGYVEFVEENRGLEFLYPVAVERVNIESNIHDINESATNELSADDLRWYTNRSTSLALLGLMDPSEDVLSRQSGAQEAGAYAYYDSYSDVIYLPEGESGPFLEGTIVHELVHALQDQHGFFDYTPWTVDESIMHLALSEGDAEHIEGLWAEARADSGATSDQTTDDGDLATFVDTSDYFEASFAAPYLLGRPAVDVLIETSGYAEINRLLAKGPGSGERLVDPLSSTPSPAPAQERFVDVDDANLDEDSIVFESTLGPVGLFQILSPGAGADQAFLAIEGFDADAYVLTEESSGHCVHLIVWVDTPTDAIEFRVAAQLAGFESLIGDRGQPAAPSVLLKTCEPVGNPSDQGLHTLAPLIVANEMTAYHLKSGIEPTAARCAALAQARAHGEVERGEPIDWRQLLDRSVAFVSSCR